MGNRIADGLCVRCGMPVIYPPNKYHACTQCTEWIEEESRRRFNQHKANPKKTKHMVFGDGTRAKMAARFPRR